MSRVFLFALVLLLAGEAAVPGDATLPAQRDEPFPMALCFVPEMSYIPEVDDWEFCPPDQFTGHAAAARAAWERHIPWATGHVTPAIARNLSRWARPQMASYNEFPPLAGAKLSLVGRHPRGGRFVYEITVDTLPSHAPLVTRWLKVYLLYDAGSKSMLRMTVTVRGERLE
jgi:hypothetical protein